MTLVVAASAGCKWGIEAAGSAAAEALLAAGEPLVAPDLIVPEMANALATRLRRGEIVATQADPALGVLVGSLDEILPTATLAGRAVAIATRLQHPDCDCFQAALAEHRSARLVTADACRPDRLATAEWARMAVALQRFAPPAWPTAAPVPHATHSLTGALASCSGWQTISTSVGSASPRA